MFRVALLLTLTLSCGCGISGSAPGEVAPSNESTAASSQQRSAFHFDEAAGIIFLDAQVSPGQRQGFSIGQGSITLETIKVEDNNLRFQYTPEIEGGYTVYECIVPVSASPITVRVNKDGTPGDTSFDLTKCRVVKAGNLHWE